MKYSTACAKDVKLGSLGACSLKEIFEIYASKWHVEVIFMIYMINELNAMPCS